ncbi:MAG: hypothetical protein ABIP77_04125 [Candidatus Limnocylindrales bacterium]
MTANDPFDRVLRGFLESAAPITAPASLHDHVIERARRSTQRPGWLVGIRGGHPWSSGARFDRPWASLGYLLVVLAIVLTALAVAIAVGAFRPDPINPLLGRNGAIVYVLQDQSADMHVVGADGTGPHEIAGGSCPTYSPDGSLLAYWTGDSPELVISAADGSAPRHMGIFGEGPYGGDRFALSPDGRRFAWIERVHAYEGSDPDGGTTTVGWDDELWVIPVSGGAGVRIVPISGVKNEARALPGWSPDGRRIAYSTFVSTAAETHRSSIDVIDADGSNQTRLTSRPGAGLGGMSWSPDSRFIAYSGLPDGSVAPSADPRAGRSADFPPLDIFVVRADGSADRNLTNTGVNEAGPQWSPDGSHLAYRTTGEDFGERVDTIRMDGSVAIGPPATGPINSEFFSWSPDGSRLLLVQTASTGATDRLGATRSTILSIDPEFQNPSQTLVDVDYVVLCAPSWQRLEP